jgi:hypothetical protein
MTSPISHQAYVPQTSAQTSARNTSAIPASAPQHSQQDEVHLSPQALAASGGVDHDGDSH